MADSQSWGKKCHLEHLVIPDRKTASKTTRLMSKDAGTKMKRLTLADKRTI